jgi:hypothetical protein
MADVYFHCSDAEHIFIDRRGAAVDLSEAFVHAERLVRAMVMSPNTEDWREWVLHATDELGDELFALPFTAVLGKLH